MCLVFDTSNADAHAMHGFRREKVPMFRLRLRQQLCYVSEPNRRCRESQVNEHKLLATLSRLFDNLEFKYHRLTSSRQVFDDVSVSVHMDVHRTAFRMNTKCVVAILLADCLSDNPVEVMLTQSREEPRNH